MSVRESDRETISPPASARYVAKPKKSAKYQGGARCMSVRESDREYISPPASDWYVAEL